LWQWKAIQKVLWQMNFQKKSILLVIMLVYTAVLHAQAENPLFRRIGQQNGLSNSRVTCFLKDRMGYLWVGTAMGLNRYDGLQFEKFMHNSYNPASLSWNVITALEEDKEGNIWIGTEAGGLNMYNPATKKFTHYRARKNSGTTIADDHIRSLKADAQNNIWIGYSFEGWSVLNLDTEKFIHEKSKLNFINHWGDNAANCVTGFVHDGIESTWITSTYGLVHKNNSTGAITTFTDNAGKYYDQNENLFIKPVLMGDTAVALATWGCGIKYFHLKSKTFKSYLFDKQYKEGAFTNVILDISHKGNDEFWVASADKGLGIFNAHTKVFKFFRHNPDDDYTPPPKECRVVYKDRDGMLWAGFDYGLCFWAASLQNFRATTLHDFTGPAMDNASVLATCYLPSRNSIYFSRLFGKGLYEIQENTGKITCHLFPIAFTREDSTINIRSITQLQNNKLLLQASTGWFTFNTLSRKIEKATISYNGNLLEPDGNSSKPDKEGNAWVTDNKQKLYRINMSTLQVAMPKEGLVHKYPLQSYSFIAGAINKKLNWISDRNFGLCILNTETNIIDTSYLQKGLSRIK
jgi:ligand-binding sensor domain-containing protein